MEEMPLDHRSQNSNLIQGSQPRKVSLMGHHIKFFLSYKRTPVIFKAVKVKLSKALKWIGLVGFWIALYGASKPLCTKKKPLCSNRAFLKQTQAAANRNEHGVSQLGSILSELEETNQNLEQALEERLKMVNCLTSLRGELEQTKMQLNQLKAIETRKFQKEEGPKVCWECNRYCNWDTDDERRFGVPKEEVRYIHQCSFPLPSHKHRGASVGKASFHG